MAWVINSNVVVVFGRKQEKKNDHGRQILCKKVGIQDIQNLIVS